MIHDNVFGELEFDYTWFKYTPMFFFDKEQNIILMVAGDEEGEFEEGQYDAYKALMNQWDSLPKTLLNPILDYYNEKREELGFHIESNENYPAIESVEELLTHITLTGIKVPYANIYGERSIGISFDCSWDLENGLGLRLNNEQVIKVGYQDIVV